MECWYDKKGIESSSQFEYVICKAIDNADVVLFMHSKAHLEVDFANDWTVKELNYALRTKKRVILVHLDDAPLRNIFLMEFSTRNNIDSQDPEQWDRLMNDLRRWLKLDPSDSVVRSEMEYEEGDGSAHGIKSALGRLANAGTRLNFRKTKNKIEELYIKGKEIIEKGEEYLAENYRIAAEQGDAHAQYKLGRKYKLGSGVDTDYGEAVRWFQKAAEQDFAAAQYNLGVMYEYGYGVDRDLSLAKYWYEKAADQGDKDAIAALAGL